MTDPRHRERTDARLHRARARCSRGRRGPRAHRPHGAQRASAPEAPPDPPAVAERVSVLVPARNEAHRIAATITSLLAQRQLTDLEVLVLDDGSEDGTAEVVATHRRRRPPGAGADRDRDLPAGWLGKPHACQQLADAATGSVLVLRRRRRRRWHRTPSPRPSRCCARPGFDARLARTRGRWPTDCGRAPRAAAAAVVVADDPAAGRGGATHHGRPWSRPTASSSPSTPTPTAAPVVTRQSADDVLDDIALMRAVKRAGGTRRAGRRLARWPPAGCTTPGTSWSRATPSRCGRRSAPRPAPPPWWPPSAWSTSPRSRPPCADHALGLVGYGAGVLGRAARRPQHRSTVAARRARPSRLRRHVRLPGRPIVAGTPTRCSHLEGQAGPWWADVADVGSREPWLELR